MTIHDVAAYVLQKKGTLTAMKLQKLCFYSQAWHLVWEEEPLFNEDFEAWANGPVAPALYEKHSGQFKIADWPSGDSKALSESQRESVDAVLEAYFKYSAQQLSDMTHRERPWLDCRAGIPAGERSSNVITQAAMAEFYSGLEPG